MDHASSFSTGVHADDNAVDDDQALKHMFWYIRHELTNAVSPLSLAEFEKYGNNDRTQRLSQMIQEMVQEDFIMRRK